jgi:hypothetical protein
VSECENLDNDILDGFRKIRIGERNVGQKVRRHTIVSSSRLNCGRQPTETTQIQKIHQPQNTKNNRCDVKYGCDGKKTLNFLEVWGFFRGELLRRTNTYTRSCEFISSELAQAADRKKRRMTDR